MKKVPARERVGIPRFMHASPCNDKYPTKYGLDWKGIQHIGVDLSEKEESAKRWFNGNSMFPSNFKVACQKYLLLQ